MPNYAPIPGFDIAKINDPTHVNDKYSPALRAFSEAMAAGIPLTRGNLAPQVDWAKSHGFANAKQVGDDSIDFGDTRGPIDLIRGGDDATMFLDKAVWGQAPPAPTGTSAPPPAMGTRGAPDTTQADLVRQSLLSLGGGMSPGMPEAPQPMDPTAAPPTNQSDQIMGNYDDILRQQILDQMKAD